MKPVLNIGKAIVIGVWVWAFAGSFGVPVPMADMGPMVVLGLAAAHAVEIGVFLPKLRDAGGSTMGHVFGLLVFGVFHYQGARGGK